MAKKTYLFVDGTNLYAGQYSAFGPQKYLDFQQFVTEIESNFKIKFDKIYVYASYSPKPQKTTKKEQSYLTNEALFFRSVRKHKKVIFFKGYRSLDGKEKLVDVQLAVDIVDKAHLREYSDLYLCSGDADYTHALEIAKRLRRKINVLSLSTRIPNRLSYLYPTTIFSINNKLSKIHKHQKITIVSLNQKKVSIEIKTPESKLPGRVKKNITKKKNKVNNKFKK